MIKAQHLGSHDDLRAVWPQVKILDARRVIFRIGGHKFRLVADMRYDLGRVYIRWIGTHEEYNDINPEEV